MNYKNVKESMVQKGITDELGVKRFMISLALFLLFASLTLAVLTGATVGIYVSVIVELMTVGLFFFAIDYAKQDRDSFSEVAKVTSFWWIPLITMVLTIVLLLVFNFI